MEIWAEITDMTLKWSNEKTITVFSMTWMSRPVTFPQSRLVWHRHVWHKNYPWDPASRREKTHFHLNFQMLKTLASGTFSKTFASIYLFSSGLNQFDPFPMWWQSWYWQKHEIWKFGGKKKVSFSYFTYDIIIIIIIIEVRTHLRMQEL